jgi:tetratricopeptide (TPR) repeat protein
MPRLSVTVIARDEEATLPACLASAAGLADEVVVVDTGSADRTRDVAAAHGARVLDFPWRDDFAAARNEALRHATGDWVLWLDADDRLDDANRDKLRDLLAGLGDDNAAFVLKNRSGHGRDATTVDQVRLFRNHPDARWEYRVHEQILPALRRAGFALHFTDIVIHHAGYQDPALTRRKLERNLRLLLLEQAEQPDDPFTLFNLGWAHAELGRPAEALPHLLRSLERSQPGDSIVRKLYALVAGCHRRLGRPAEALAACRLGRVHYPDDEELLLLQGSLHAEQGDAAGAEACWRRLPDGAGPGAAPAGAGLPPLGDGAFRSVPEGLRGRLARHCLAGLCRAQGRDAEAEAHWRAALDDDPSFLPAVVGLAELFLARGRWDDLEQAADRLAQEPDGACEAAVFRARGLLARRDFPAARRLLDETAARFPRALPPRVVLTHVLLQEGGDPAAAERALREVLDRDPSQAESWRNLAVLLRHQGRLAEAAAVCQSARLSCPDDPELLLLYGVLLRERGDLTRAETCLLQVLERTAAAGGPPARARAARQQLALTYRDQGRPAEAAAQWRALLAEEPGLPAAWAGLGGACLELQRWAEAEQAAERLAGLAGGELEAALLRGRLRLARKDFAAVRQGMEDLIARHPQLPAPRVLLSYALLQEGRDLDAAERALRDLLAVDPGNAEAAHNLAVLRRRQQGTAAG